MKLFVRLIAALSVLLAAATAAIAQASGQGWLGVQVAQVTKADADALGWEDLHGVKVMKTVPGGPAEQAGLMMGHAGPAGRLFAAESGEASRQLQPPRQSI